MLHRPTVFRRASTVRALALVVLLAARADFLSAQAAASHDPRARLLVTTSWLAQHLNDPDLVLLHVGDRTEYDHAHIAGARYVSLRDVDAAGGAMEPGKLTLELPKPDDLRQRLAALGISDRSRIVVYYGNDWVSPATRVIFTLDYAGLGNATSLLDGGMGAWTRDGHPTTDVVPAARTGELSTLRTRPLVVDADWVHDHLKSRGVVIVDGRAAAFYDGVEAGRSHDGPQRRGHIAGARSIPFTEVTDDKVALRDSASLAALFRGAGVQPGDTVVAYCHIGQQATAVIFAARTLGIPAKLYDGAFEDWSRHTDYPVEQSGVAGKAP